MVASASVTVSPALAIEAYELASSIRRADAEEVMASCSQMPLDVILHAIAISEECWTVYFGDGLACIWGVVPHADSMISGRVGVAWMLTAETVERHPKLFWGECLRILPRLLSRWDELLNAIDIRHEQAIRWAERLGFRLEEPAPFGAAGLPFRRFRVRKADLCVSR